jgi:hypothetical protein
MQVEVLALPQSDLAPLFFSLLFEVVYNDFGEKRLALFHKFQVLRMILVFILSLCALELNVQRDLVRLVHNIAMASRHLTDMEIHNAGDWRQVLRGRGDKLSRGIRLAGVGPKDDYVREHSATYNENLARRNRCRGLPLTQGTAYRKRRLALSPLPPQVRLKVAARSTNGCPWNDKTKAL